MAEHELPKELEWIVDAPQAAMLHTCINHVASLSMGDRGALQYHLRVYPKKNKGRPAETIYSYYRRIAQKLMELHYERKRGTSAQGS